MIDGGYDIDISAVMQNIDEAEVVTLYFPIIRKTLLIDTRCGPDEGPLVRVVPMVNNVDERFKALRELRPGMPRPQSITVIPWAHAVNSLRWAGVWDCVVARLERCGDRGTLAEARHCFRQLRSLELAEIRQAITGDQYRTLWGPDGAGDGAEPPPTDSC